MTELWWSAGQAPARRKRATAAGLVFLAAAAASGEASGATTATWELTGYADFLRGRMSGLSVTRDGRLMLGPKLEPFFSSDQPNIWSIAQGPDGSLYLGTGNRGRLIKVDSQGRGSVLWTAEQSQIFAVAVDRAGVVYAGVSPEGKIYRIENGRAVEYFAPGEPYIWALAIAPDGTLYAGTGQQGKIFRVTGAGRGDLYYETGQMHVTALVFDREGRLLAGSEPNGILYRIAGTPARAFVLYDANLPEIRSILTAPDGTIYAAALGGSIARRTGAATSTTSNTTPTVVAPATSITVTDAQAGLVQPPKPAAPAAQSSTVSGTVASVSSTTEVTGVERSALYRIQPDNTVETLWSSKEENIYDIAADASGALLLLTDAQGRIYRLDPRPNGSRDTALIAQANEGDATRLLASARGVLAATSNAGKIFRLGAAPDTAVGAAGWFESPIHDAGAVARWGRLHWVGTARGVAVKTRTGNSARPDGTWSDWSAALTDQAGVLIASPNARYIQWRAELTSANPVAEIDSVTIAYLPQNSAPTVRSITVSAAGAKAASSTSTASSAFSITVTDTGDSTTAAGTQSQTFSRPAGQQMQISWQADDPEGDKLSYSLYFRGEDEREWKLLRANLAENSHTVDGDALADGRYFFRVVASDRPSNPAPQARQSELTSAPVLLDSTPPEVRAGTPRRNGGAVEIEINAQDRGSALRRCEYSIDAQPWLPVEASDGVTDSLAERFVMRADNFPQGEHVVVIRVYDAAGNAGLARVVVR